MNKGIKIGLVFLITILMAIIVTAAQINSNIDTSGYSSNVQKVMETGGLMVRIDYNGTTNPVWVGYAAPGTLTSATNWKIKQITYDANGNPTAVQYAQGSANFVSAWDNRSNLYTYS